LGRRRRGLGRSQRRLVGEDDQLRAADDEDVAGTHDDLTRDGLAVHRRAVGTAEVLGNEAAAYGSQAHVAP